MSINPEKTLDKIREEFGTVNDFCRTINTPHCSLYAALKGIQKIPRYEKRSNTKRAALVRMLRERGLLVEDK